MGQIQYTKISDSKCNDCNKTVYDIPIGSTPYEIAVITGLCLEDSISISENIIQENNELCPTIYTNSEKTKNFTKYCTFGGGSSVTVTVPAGQFSSQISQDNADKKAEENLEEIGQTTANQLGTCPDNDCLSCLEYVVISTSSCGEYRQINNCTFGECIPDGETYFACTGNCVGEDCVDITVCPEGEQGDCPEGYICSSINNCIRDCDGAECSDDCLNGSCPAGFSCVNGKCAEDPPDCIKCSATCPNGTCPPGYSCSSVGNCTIDCAGKECSSDCISGSCPDCGTCNDGICVPKTCGGGQVLNTTTCQCEAITCEPPCGEIEDISLDTECSKAFVTQVENISNGVCNCITPSNPSIRYEPKDAGLSCLNGTGQCDGAGNCQTGCLTTCPENTTPVTDTNNECLENYTSYNCELTDCLPVTVTDPRTGESCNNSLGTCNDQGDCISSNIPCGFSTGNAVTDSIQLEDRVLEATFNGYVIVEVMPSQYPSSGSDYSDVKIEIFKAFSYPAGGIPDTSTFPISSIIASTGQGNFSNFGQCANSDNTGCLTYETVKFDPNSGITNTGNLNNETFTCTALSPSYLLQTKCTRYTTGNVSLNQWFIGQDSYFPRIYNTRESEIITEIGRLVSPTINRGPGSADAYQFLYAPVNGTPESPELIMVRTTLGSVNGSRDRYMKVFCSQT